MTEQEIKKMIESCGVVRGADRAHIDALRAKTTADLRHWCARRRHAADLRRFAVAVCLVVAVPIVSGSLKSGDAVALNVTTTGGDSDRQICENIYYAISQL